MIVAITIAITRKNCRSESLEPRPGEISLLIVAIFPYPHRDSGGGDSRLKWKMTQVQRWMIGKLDAFTRSDM